MRSYLGSSWLVVSSFAVLAGGAACKKRQEPQPREATGSGSSAAAPTGFDQISRADFNKFAVRLDLPVYWVEDKNNNKTLDPDEVEALLFYPTSGTMSWVKDGALTPRLRWAYDKIVAASNE